MSSPLPPDFHGDAQIYYQTTYNINLFDYNIRRQYDISSLPQYNYTYARVQLLKAHLKAILVQEIIAKTKAENLTGFSFHRMTKNYSPLRLYFYDERPLLMICRTLRLPTLHLMAS
jgi:hypothetical protein